MKRLVALVGGDPCTPAEATFAEEIAFTLASHGLGLVTGGLGGVMEAACRGALRGGGVTVGILPGSDPRAANASVEIPIPTGMGELRNGLVVAAAGAVVAVSGEYGTLSEIALALKGGKPVIGWRTWELDRTVGQDGSIIAVASVAEAWSELAKAMGLSV